MNGKEKQRELDARFWKYETVKALKASSTVLIIGFLISVAAFPVKASTPTLADQLNAATNTVDWVYPQSWIIPHFSLIFTGQNIYDTVLPAISDFKTLIQSKRIAELDDINSSSLNQLVAQAMDNQTMVGHWPSVDPHLMSVYWKYMVIAYRYAMELGSNASKWNKDLAYEEFLRCWQADPDFLWFDAQNRTPPGPTGGDRYYDENAQVLSIFLKFYQIGVTDAINYATQMWTHLYINHWNRARDYFPYSPISPQAECEAGPFAETIGELYASNQNGLPNFPDYILRDLDYKFISGGNWSAKLWSPGAYVVRHAESNPEKRLENTVTAWAAMQSYYGLMNRSMQTNFVDLLTGSPSAWQGMIDNSGLFKDGRFRWNQNTNYTDDATCGGMMTLFLNGIVPESGSLAIPVIDEVYQDWYSMFPASHFRFDYASRTIRIPVWAGKINFILGTEPASYNFSQDGIYDIHFGTDWNSVTDANLVNPLNSRFTYLDPTHSDIAVTNLTISKSVIGQGYSGSVNVIVENQGVANETFNVTLYANATAIFQQSIGLSAGTDCTISFDWNTTKFANGDYIIVADIEPLPKETDTSDNDFNASVHVSVPGDISGPIRGDHDGKCDLRDINYLIRYFNTHSRSLNWNPNCDIDGSGRVDLRDIFIALLNFNKRE